MEAHINLGNVFLYQKDYASAAGEYQTALSSKPDSVLAHYNYGLVLTGQNNVDGAMEQYRQALKYDPKYSNAYYAIALLYQAQNNVPDAITSFEKYLALEPSGTYSENVRSSLDKIRQATGQGVPRCRCRHDPGQTTGGAQRTR